jgi:hypothetical protein
MADPLFYKQGTDVYKLEGNYAPYKLNQEQFQGYGINYDLLGEGQQAAKGLNLVRDTETKQFIAGGGVLGQPNAAVNAGITLPVKSEVPVTTLENPITRADLNNIYAYNQANLQKQYEDQLAQQNQLFEQTLAKMQLTPEEKLAQERLLGLQQLQTQAIQRVQERPLEGATLRSGMESEIQNIASGNTRESLVNLRQQTFEAERLNLLTTQRRQELESLKMQLEQGNINTDNLFKYQQLNQEMQSEYLDRIEQLNTNARTALGTILDRFKGLTLDSLSPENLNLITTIAQQAGIPFDILRDGMKVVADQIKAQQDLNRYQAETSRINATRTGGGNTDQLYSGLSTPTATAVRSKVSKFSTEPAVQNFATIQSGYNFAKSLSSTTKNPADDQALIYSLAKALDPGSVVREGEYATAQKYSQSWIQAYGKGVEQALAGTGFLSETARNNIKKTIEQKYLSEKKTYDNLYNNYTAGINALTGRNDGNQFLVDYVTPISVTDFVNTSINEITPPTTETKSTGAWTNFWNWLST